MHVNSTQSAALIDAVRRAGACAMRIYASNTTIAYKDDRSPVTEADLEVDRILSATLRDLFAGVPVVTEEQASSHGQPVGDAPFFLVDPIDGTKEFINKTGEFTINVALIVEREPVFGIVHAPAIDRMFIGNEAAFEICRGEEKPLSVAGCGGLMRAVASRSHSNAPTEDFLDRHQIGERVSAGSSLKFCLLAAGEADVYPRFGPTMEWDTAAGHAVLKAAGGMVLLPNGEPLTYAKPGFRNPDFIACSPDARMRCGLDDTRKSDLT